MFQVLVCLQHSLPDYDVRNTKVTSRRRINRCPRARVIFRKRTGSSSDVSSKQALALRDIVSRNGTESTDDE